MATLNYLAMDFGASNGRGIVGNFDGSRLTMSEVHRFSNNYVHLNGMMYWDVLRLHSDILHAISSSNIYQPVSLGIDTWGVDYGLLDKKGKLLGNPICYRQASLPATNRVHEIMPRKELFERTGVANHVFNTIYQLHDRRHNADAALEKAETMLLIPDLLGYFLTGIMGSEYTNVTTTGLYSPHMQDWDWEIIRRIGLPNQIFTPIHSPSNVRGKVLGDICDKNISLVSVATHDTGSAVAAVPGRGSFAFLSSGTWSLIGVEMEKQVINDSVYKAQFSNEGTLQGTFRPLKNIMGLWLLQECRREWLTRGETCGWDDIIQQASSSHNMHSIIDPDDPIFFSAGNMVVKIQAYCRNSNQHVPETIGEIASCVYKSLALKYRWAIEKLEIIKGQKLEALHIVGGGAQNKLLNQFTANALNRPVLAGPVECACIGNLLSQAMAFGEISTLEQLRQVVRNSFEIEEYLPVEREKWDESYGRLLQLIEEKSICI